jgi:Tfp pilus assembly protein PilO
MNKDEITGKWHLDKRVPITLILAIIIQTLSFVWFFSKMDSRIASLEANLVAQRDRDDRQDSNVKDGLHTLRADIKEIDRKIDRLIERGQR